METYEFPQKAKNRQPFDPAVPLQCIYPKEIRKEYWRDVCASVFTSALFTRATLCPSMNKWIENKWNAYKYKNIYSYKYSYINAYIKINIAILFSLKKEGNSHVEITWIILESIMLSHDINQTKK